MKALNSKILINQRESFAYVYFFVVIFEPRALFYKSTPDGAMVYSNIIYAMTRQCLQCLKKHVNIINKILVGYVYLKGQNLSLLVVYYPMVFQ